MYIYNPFTASVWAQHAERVEAADCFESEIEDLSALTCYGELEYQQGLIKERLNKLDDECERAVKDAEEHGIVPLVFEDLHYRVRDLLEDSLYGVCIEHAISCLGFNESDNDALREGY